MIHRDESFNAQLYSYDKYLSLVLRRKANTIFISFIFQNEEPNTLTLLIIHESVLQDFRAF